MIVIVQRRSNLPDVIVHPLIITILLVDAVWIIWSFKIILSNSFISFSSKQKYLQWGLQSQLHVLTE
jgi:hypothetical protein